MPRFMRVRTGIRLYDEGWRVVTHVITDQGTDEYLSDLVYSHEADAEMAASKSAAMVRAAIARVGR